jgi:hypothetical protein
MATGPLLEITNPSLRPFAYSMWDWVHSWLGLPCSWHVVGIRNALCTLLSGHGLAAVG